MADAVEGIRLATAAVMLVGAAWSDLRTRRVRNHYWFPFVALAAVFVVHDLSTRPRQELLAWYAVAAASSLFWYGVWWLRLFGGADAKGLMVLAWLVPFPLHQALPVPPSLAAVAGGSIAALLLPLVFLGTNIVRRDVSLPAALLGVRMDLDRAQARHVWPMQRATPDGIRWRYWQHLGDDMDEVYAALRSAHVPRVWTTPKIPFLGLVAAGFFGAWAVGAFVRLPGLV